MVVSIGYVTSRNGARIFTASERGKGTPLLISHAITNPGASTIMTFEPGLAFNRGLAGGGSWYMYDVRKSGRSSPTEGQPTFEDLVDDLVAVSEQIGEPFDLYGRTEGSFLAVALAIRYPERVRRMLLVSPQRLPTEFKRVAEYAQRTLRLFKVDPVGTLAAHLMWGHPGVDSAIALEAAKHHIEMQPVDTLRVLRRAFDGVDLAEVAAGLKVPALLLTQNAEMHLAIEAAACLPNVSIVSWNNLGDGTVNGQAWRQAWDEAVPPVRLAPGHSAVQLTDREREVLGVLCRGLSNAEIAEDLAIASSTVKRHVANIFDKLGVSSRPQAIARAFELGLVAPPGQPR